MKITAHMLDGNSLSWDDVATVLVLSGAWARLLLRGEPWEKELPWEERKYGKNILLQIEHMEYWEQDRDELDEEDEIKGGNWLNRQADKPEDEPPIPGEGEAK